MLLLIHSLTEMHKVRLQISVANFKGCKAQWRINRHVDIISFPVFQPVTIDINHKYIFIIYVNAGDRLNIT